MIAGDGAVDQAVEEGWRQHSARGFFAGAVRKAFTNCKGCETVETRHRGKGQQKVTVEHVHVHSGGQAVVGMVGAPGGGGSPKLEDQPHAKQIAYALQPPMWKARIRRGSQCQSPMPNGRCRLHGGKSPGAPKGNKNAYIHGYYAAETIATRREIATLLHHW